MAISNPIGHIVTLPWQHLLCVAMVTMCYSHHCSLDDVAANCGVVPWGWEWVTDSVGQTGPIRCWHTQNGIGASAVLGTLLVHEVTLEWLGAIQVVLAPSNHSLVNTQAVERIHYIPFKG